MLPALALAGALTYVIGDLLGGFISPAPLVWLINAFVFFAIYKITKRVLDSLKE